MPHDIFISHSTQDRDVAGLMCAELEGIGLSCWIAPRDIAGGEAWDEAIMRGLEKCRMVLLVFSQVSNDSPHVKREILMAIEMKKKLLPVRIEHIHPGRQLEFILAGIQWFDAFSPPFESHLSELKKQAARIVAQTVDANGTNPSNPSPPQQPTIAAPNVIKSDKPEIAKPRVALLYKRNTQPDCYVLKVLEHGFQEAGYDVFVDRHMQIGVEWAHEIERNIRAADAVIPILSPASMESEMVNYEVEIARGAAQAQHGKPRLLPVRVGYEGSLGETLDAILKPLQYALWNNQKDDEAVVKQLLQALQARDEPNADAVREEEPGGAVPTTSKFYIPRPSDDALALALRRKDTIVLIKGGRQMGKTSLVARGLQQARTSGATVVYTDLQKLNNSDLTNIQQFYFSLSHMLADQLDIDVDIEDTWKDRRAPSVNFEQYLKKQVMAKVRGHLFWALDEVDRLFTTEFGSEVFGLFRSWHNERASNPDTPWNSLTMIIAYATEAHLFIADPNQSPFNVGTRLELRDFNIEQEEALNKLFGSPLFTGDQISLFYELLSGQPYLVGRGLHELATSKMPFEEFAARADHDEGPFGDHLRRILVMLARDPKMIQAVRTVLDGSNTLTMETFYRLRAAGIVVGEGASNAKMRCMLYTNYLRGHLRESA
jgi:AAA-like domain/TIR domain